MSNHWTSACLAGGIISLNFLVYNLHVYNIPRSRDYENTWLKCGKYLLYHKGVHYIHIALDLLLTNDKDSKQSRHKAFQRLKPKKVIPDLIIWYHLFFLIKSLVNGIRATFCCKVVSLKLSWSTWQFEIKCCMEISD